MRRLGDDQILVPVLSPLEVQGAGVRVTHDGLAQAVDAVIDMPRRAVFHVFLAVLENVVTLWPEGPADCVLAISC